MRTYPAAPLLLNNLSQIVRIYSVLRPGYINISQYYRDPFSTSNNSLVSMATVVNYNSNTRIIIQIEMIYAAISVLYRNVLYFPGSTIIYCYYNPVYTGESVYLLSYS